MATATINGVELYYETHGDGGEPLVLVHGYTGDITDWRHQLPEFSTTHRVLAFDHRGHGQSQAPSDRSAYSMPQLADDVESLVQMAGFERYHLVGHSMGGAIVQEIALRRPGRLMSLTLHDTAHVFGLGRNPMVQQWIEQRHRIAETQGMAAVANMPSPLPSPPHLSAERQEESKQRLARMSVDSFIGAWQGLHEWEGTAGRAQDISVPTLVIYGELDAGLIDAARFLATAIPGATLEMIPEAGHSPQFERPELFNAVLRRHLDRNASAAAK
jgi:pimeloyl-ACP methyl ester carboxylesterase